MGRSKSIRKIAMIAILAGVLFAVEFALSYIPGLQLTQFLIIVYVFTIGFKETLLIVTIHTLLDNLIMGSISLIYTPAMLLGWLLLVIIVKLINKEDKVLLGFIAFFHAFIYAFLFMIVSVWIMGLNDPIPYLIADIPWTIGMGVSGFLSTIFLYDPIIKTLKRLLENRKEKNMKINTPITKDKIYNLKSGDYVYITGTIYTGRDAAHKRLIEALNKKEPLPFDLEDQVIYYVGPTPAKPNKPIGSCGPTSSYRMDAYSPLLMEKGLRVMIGKGERSNEFVESMILNKGVYLQAVGGAGALLAKKVKKAEIVAYEDLGPEAIYKLEVEDFPAIVTYDVHGGNLMREEQSKYKRD